MIQMIGNPDTTAHEWMNGLYGAPIQPAEFVAMRLVHELAWEGGVLRQWHLAAHDRLQWRVHLLQPDDKSRHVDLGHRILVSGEGCWPHCVSPEAMRACVQQGVSLAWFDRLELADDPPSAARQGAYFNLHPTSQSGCLMVWAWGLAVTAQALKTLHPACRVCVMGHSRGGKAALLAAALDDAIDAVVANNSGTGGTASLAVSSEGAESLQALVAHYPHWFGEAARQSSMQARLAQLDCTALWQKIAPRPLLILQAQGDAWANPSGTRHTHGVLKKHWPDEPEGALVLIERQGAHAMQTCDWDNAASWWRHVRVRQ